MAEGSGAAGLSWEQPHWDVAQKVPEGGAIGGSRRPSRVCWGVSEDSLCEPSLDSRRQCCPTTPWPSTLEGQRPRALHRLVGLSRSPSFLSWVLTTWQLGGGRLHAVSSGGPGEGGPTLKLAQAAHRTYFLALSS